MTNRNFLKKILLVILFRRKIWKVAEALDYIKSPSLQF